MPTGHGQLGGEQGGAGLVAGVADLEEVAFENDVYLLRKEKAKALTQPSPAAGGEPDSTTSDTTSAGTVTEPAPELTLTPGPEPPQAKSVTFRVTGSVPLESWNRLGTKLLPKLRSGQNPEALVDLSCTVDSLRATTLASDIRRALEDLGLTDRLAVNRESD